MTADNLSTAVDGQTHLRQLMDRRHSCRGFLPDQLPEATIEEILDITRRTPSWCNTQPWQVHVVTGQAIEMFRRGLRDYVSSQPQQPDLPYPKRYAGEYRKRRKDCALQLYDSVGVAEGDRPASAAQALKNFDLFGAPHVAIITTESDLGVYGAVDCGIYINSLLLAAESLGVATVPQAALAGCAPYLREFLGLAEGRQVVCGISFGLPDPRHPANNFRTPRLTVPDFVTWHKEATP